MRYTSKFSAIEGIVIFLIVAIVLFFGFCTPKWDRNRINERMAENGEAVKSIDTRFIHTGPYWAWKGTRTYRVVTDSASYFVRFGTWDGPNISKEVGHDYEELKW